MEISPSMPPVKPTRRKLRLATMRTTKEDMEDSLPSTHEAETHAVRHMHLLT